MNRARCEELDIADKVAITTGAYKNRRETRVLDASRRPREGDFNNPLPAAWTSAFDFVWSAEVLCHAGDKAELLSELARCLKPGGVFVFSDIMGSDTADENELKAFTDRNATTALGRPAEYRVLLQRAGLRHVAWWDNSHHLERYFRAMLAQIDAHEGCMLAAGLSEAYLAKWRSSLQERAATQAQHAVFAWGVTVARKPGGASESANGCVPGAHKDLAS